MGLHKGIRTNDFNFLDGVIQKPTSSYGSNSIVIFTGIERRTFFSNVRIGSLSSISSVDFFYQTVRHRERSRFVPQIKNKIVDFQIDGIEF